MTKLTSEQTKERNEFLAKMVSSGKMDQKTINRIMNDPAKLRIFNALVAATS